MAQHGRTGGNELAYLANRGIARRAWAIRPGVSLSFDYYARGEPVCSDLQCKKLAEAEHGNKWVERSHRW